MALVEVKSYKQQTLVMGIAETEMLKISFGIVRQNDVK